MTEATLSMQVENGLRAFEAFKSELAPKIKKLDALDEEKFARIEAEITAAMQKSQDDEAKRVAIENDVKSLQAALNRPNTGAQKTDEVKEKAQKLFHDFLKNDENDRQYFSTFAKENAAAHGLELKDLSVNVDFNGGFLVMPTFGGVIQTRVFETSPIRQLASNVTISTDAYEVISDADQATGGWVSEQQARPNTATPALDKITIPVHELYANPVATQKLLDDAGINAEGWLADKVADIIARTENTAFVNGTGVGQPRGFLTYTSGTTVRSAQIEQINSGTSATVTYGGLVDLQVSLKEKYQGNASFLMRRATVGNIMKILDSQNRPIFNLMPADNKALIGSIMTRPIYFADDMPTVAANALAIAYGDFKAAYTIVDRIGLRILRDAFTSKPNVQFYTTKRVGGGVVNFEAIKIQRLA